MTFQATKYRYPLRLQLEMFNRDIRDWELINSFEIKNKSNLTDKIIFLRTYYKLEGKNYRIVLIINSKMNKS